MRIVGKLPLLCDGWRDGWRDGCRGGCWGWQREAEPCAAARRVFHPDALPVGLDERLGDGQAEARAGVVGPAREQREDLVASAGADAGALISNRDLDRVRFAALGADRNGGVFRAVPDRV